MKARIVRGDCAGGTCCCYEDQGREEGDHAGGCVSWPGLSAGTACACHLSAGRGDTNTVTSALLCCAVYCTQATLALTPLLTLTTLFMFLSSRQTFCAKRNKTHHLTFDNPPDHDNEMGRQTAYEDRPCCCVDVLTQQRVMGDDCLAPVSSVQCPVSGQS